MTWAEITPDTAGRRRWWAWHTAPTTALIVQVAPNRYAWRVRVGPDLTGSGTDPTVADAIARATDAIRYAAVPAR